MCQIYGCCAVEAGLQKCNLSTRYLTLAPVDRQPLAVWPRCQAKSYPDSTVCEHSDIPLCRSPYRFPVRPVIPLITRQKQRVEVNALRNFGAEQDEGKPFR